MRCQRCQSPLPKEGAICLFCGLAISEEQLKMRRELNNNHFQPFLKSELYGQNRDKIYPKNEEKENKVLGFILIIIILFLIFGILILVTL
ncbi:MAG: hypothetical protein E7172_03970 [Firmicutes bacterium]|nr:hypothetical protein [Bacillota bacterium]